jgi:hypothetical protein
MTPRSRLRAWRPSSRPDLAYAGLVALIICAGLIGRAIGILPIE